MFFLYYSFQYRNLRQKEPLTSDIDPPITSGFIKKN